MTMMTQTKGHNAMGASRDLTASARSGTATLERPAVRRPRTTTSRTTATPQPVRRYAPHALHPRNTQGVGRLGSKQVVSVRGRRVGEVKEVKRTFSTMSVIAVPLLILGVLIAMFLSGVSTSQSFTIQELQARERALSNEVETLNRDAENVKSSAEIARKAADAGMVVSHAPGILSVGADGAVEETRPFNPDATQKMTDVTSADGQRGMWEHPDLEPEQAAATVGSWVTTTSVVPSVRSASRRASTSSALSGSRLPVGSSASSSAGPLASARQKATRCASPPDSVVAGWPTLT